METLYPRNLISNLVNNNVVPFVGSGFSKPSGLPLWNELIVNLFRELEEDYDIQDLRKLYESGNISSIDAPEIYNIITTTKYPLRQYIKNSFDHLWKTNNYHGLLTKFQVDTILTTNFDSLIEDAYKQEGIAINTIYKNGDLPFFDEKRSIQLIKIHGTIEDINSIVLAKSEYSNYKQRNRLVYHLVSTIFLTRTILFLGFSLHDPNIIGLLDEIKRIVGDEMRTHYALMYSPRSDVVSKLLEYGIRVINLPHERVEESTREWLGGLYRAFGCNWKN
jgi:hypothetical protein